MSADRLYESLPSLYRERDVEEGYPLRALLRIVTSQADLLDRDIERLYEDFFIETCRPWVIPYIGDLVGADVLSDAARSDPGLAASLFADLTGRDLRPPLAARSRADVAKTISYRRRKGTLPMLEELARDVTGWAAHAVEFLDLVGWTQHVEHGRPSATWADVRSVEAMGRVDGPFDATGHTVDVRAPGAARGLAPSPPHRLLPLAAAPRSRSRMCPRDRPARRGATTSARSGSAAPLFSRLRREGDEAGMATELHVPGPIRRERFCADLAAYRDRRPPRPAHTDFYGETGDASFAIRRNGAFVPPAADAAAEPDAFEPRIVCRRLRPWPADQPSGRLIAVDVTAGRLAVGDGWPDATAQLDVSYHHGFGAALGGGSYDRAAWLVRPDLAELRIGVKADGAAPPGAPPLVVTSVADALGEWQTAGRPDAIVTILDSRAYALPAHHAAQRGPARDRGGQRRAPAAPDRARWRRDRRAGAGTPGRSRPARGAHPRRRRRRGLPAGRRRPRAPAPAARNARARALARRGGRAGGQRPVAQRPRHAGRRARQHPAARGARVLDHGRAARARATRRGSGCSTRSSTACSSARSAGRRHGRARRS